MVSLLLGCLINQDVYESRRAELLDSDGDGFVDANEGGDDCNDEDEGVFPGAVETCDDVDEDCDGTIDEDALDGSIYFVDADGDGYGGSLAPGLKNCGQPPGYVASATDCNDSNPEAFPGAGEVAYDGIDQDCDGADLTDADGDGEASAQVGGPDCDDQNPNRFASAIEDWNDLWTDNDCDGWLTTPTGEFGDSVWAGFEEGAASGQYLSGLGDIDGDEIDETLVATIYASEQHNYGGAVHVVSGDTGGALDAALTIWSGGSNWYLGVDLDGGFDVDADDVPDVALGAPGKASRGAAYIVAGAAIAVGADVQLPDDAYWAVEGDVDNQYWGVVRGVGDFNGDGLADLAVGAAFADINVPDDGAVVMMTPVAGEVAAIADAEHQWTGYYEGARYGDSLGRLGDVTGDGLTDLLVSAGTGDFAAVLPGGSGSGSIVDVSRTRYTRDETAEYYRVTTLGDVDADGRTDFVALGSSAFVFTDAWQTGVRSQTNAYSTIAADAGSHFTDATGLADQTGDGGSEFALSWFESGTGRSGAIAVVASESIPVGAGGVVADLPIRANHTGAAGEFGYRIAAAIQGNDNGRPTLLVGGGVDDTVAPDAGAVALLPLP